jgi:hypothetical protein
VLGGFPDPFVPEGYSVGLRLLNLKKGKLIHLIPQIPSSLLRRNTQSNYKQSKIGADEYADN